MQDKEAHTMSWIMCDVSLEHQVSYETYVLKITCSRAGRSCAFQFGMSLDTYMHTYIHTYIHIYTHTHTHTGMYVGRYVCIAMYVCRWVGRYVGMYVGR